MGFQGQDDADEAANRSRFLARHGLSPNDLVLAEQLHGTRVSPVGRRDAGSIVPGADALVTQAPNLLLGVRISDCFPLFLHAEEPRVAAIAHCGWRGVAGNVVGATVGVLRELGVQPRDVRAVIGPGIRVCHFEVHEDVAHRFRDYPQYIERRGDKLFLDLVGVITYQFLGCGISPENIETTDASCTYCGEREFFSYRREGRIGNMLSVVGWQAP